MRTHGLVAAGITVLLLAACSQGDSEPADPAAFCESVETLRERVAAASSGPEGLDDLARARDTATAIAESAAAVRDNAPSEIRREVRTLSELTLELAAGLADFYQALIDDPSRATDIDFLTSFQPVTDEHRRDLESASEAIQPFLSEHCGIDAPDLGGGAGPDHPPDEPAGGTSDDDPG